MVRARRFVNSAGEFDLSLWRRLPRPVALSVPELLGLFRAKFGDMMDPVTAKQIHMHKITPLSIFDWSPLRKAFAGMPLSEVRSLPGIALDIADFGAAPALESLSPSAKSAEVVEFFRKWATPLEERKKLLAFLDQVGFSTLGECSITPEMVDQSDMALGTKMALNCLLARVYFARRDESITTIERFYELLDVKFCVPAEDLQKFRDLGFGLRNLYALSESILEDACISQASARKIVLAKLIYAARADPDELEIFS